VPVLGVDPGYKHGCKCAVVSANGDQVLATDVISLQRNALSVSASKVGQTPVCVCEVYATPFLSKA